MQASNTPVAEKTLWRTPRELIDAVERRYGAIDLDAAATDEHASVGMHHINPEQDALKAQPWSIYMDRRTPVGRTLVWLNSPWGPGITKKWVERAVREVTDTDRMLHRPRAILLLTPHTDAAWWWWAAEHAAETLHLGRVPFLRPNGEQCGSPRDWHDLHVLRPGVFHPGQAVLSKWDWR